jgi:Zn-dependent protease with chaperone function
MDKYPGYGENFGCAFASHNSKRRNAMPLTQDQFDSLVARLEHDAARNAGFYRLKLGAFATLGYIYIFGVIVLLLVVIAGLIAAAGTSALVVKLIIPIVVLIGVVMKSLWVKLDAPQGLRLAPRDHRQLFETIEAVRRATRAPRAHTVLLTNELNAAIVQVPRLGMFGWQKNYLILGLPLLQLLSAEEFKAVLAHELGHLSGAHGRFGAWIYRIRAGWARLAETMRDNQHWGSFLFVPFFDWYAPKFAAYSFVQARRQEHEADGLAAAAFGATPLANALVRLDLKGEDLQRNYWPGIFAAADKHPTPSESPYRGLLSAERRGFMPQAPGQLQQALQRKTSTADTHPCLSDRLAALERPAGVPPPVAESAAEALLADKLGALVEHFDKEWQAGVAEWWRSRHEHVRKGREKLAAAAQRSPAEMNDVELFEHALLVEEFDDAEKAFELYKSLVLERGAQRGAKFAYARALLQRGDDSAIAMLEEVMRDVPETTLAACDIIVGYLQAHGRASEAQPYIDRYLERQRRDYEARVRRETVLVSDVWLPAALPAESVASLEDLLASHRDVKAAYLVRKKTAEGEPALHVEGVLRRSSMFKLESGEANQRLVNQLATEARVAEDVIFIWLNNDQRSFLKVFKKVEGARIL